MKEISTESNGMQIDLRIYIPRHPAPDDTAEVEVKGITITDPKLFRDWLRNAAQEHAGLDDLMI